MRTTLSGLFALLRYVAFYTRWRLRNKISGSNTNNIYTYHDKEFTVCFDSKDFINPVIYISFFGDGPGSTNLRFRIADNHLGYLEKINVDERLRGQKIGTALVDFTIRYVAPHIMNWKIVGINPTEEAQNFWISIIQKYPDKDISELIC